MRLLDPAEINLLAETIDPRFSAMILTAAYTGMRFGELRALRIDRFDAREALMGVASVLELHG